MFAILKRELKSYFYSPIPYVMTVVFIIISSVLFVTTNISHQSAEFNRALRNMANTLVFLIPVLTMRVLAEEKKNKTDVILYTFPKPIYKTVVGKFLAVMLVFLSMLSVTLAYPIICLIFGNASIIEFAVGYLGFILLGSSFISIGIFASSLSDNQIVSAIISFAILLLMWLLDSIAGFFGGLTAVLMKAISPVSKFEDFGVGIINFNSIVYFLSFTFYGLFLTERVLEKRRWD